MKQSISPEPTLPDADYSAEISIVPPQDLDSGDDDGAFSEQDLLQMRLAQADVRIAEQDRKLHGLQEERCRHAFEQSFAQQMYVF